MNESLRSSFNSISPSAKWLLLNKGLTKIPFAKEAVEVIWNNNNPDLFKENEFTKNIILRLIYFEIRYWSINEAIEELGIHNILEFSSGYSFRGLDLCKNPDIYYVDTDLPRLLKKKEKVLHELVNKYVSYSTSNLIMQELNVLDENAFFEITHQFPEGPIVIANEGLLVYLDIEQKRRLCSNIHKILKERGGYWVTADINIKKDENSSLNIDIFDDRGKNFLEIHNVEENKFKNYEVAENFFNDCRFNVYKKIEPNPARISSRKYLSKIPRDILEQLKNRKKTRQTWILAIQ